MKPDLVAFVTLTTLRRHSCAFLPRHADPVRDFSHLSIAESFWKTHNPRTCLKNISKVLKSQRKRQEEEYSTERYKLLL